MNGRKWTDKEIETLRTLNIQGKTPIEIKGIITDRSYDAITKKMSTLGLTMLDTTPTVTDDIEEKLIIQVKKGKKSVIELANILDIGPGRVKSLANTLQDR